MKKVILLLLLFPHLLSGQIADDFEDGLISDWTEGIPGRWKADSGGAISGNYSLHHVFDNSVSGSDCIGLPLINLHPSEGTTRWTFTLKHGYDPSSSNSWALFLMSDHDPETFSNGSDVSGFAAGVNLSGYDDTLRLWKIKKSSISVIAECPVNWQINVGTAAASKIVVERSEKGDWKISIYDSENKFMGNDSGFDAELFNPEWMVLNYRYTSTRDRLLWFDDMKVEGIFYEDTIPPEITASRITGKNSLELVFSEDPSDEILDPSRFLLNDGRSTVLSVQKKSSVVAELRFDRNFVNKTENHLTIALLCDIAGNCTENERIDFTPAWIEPADVIISEIMADPLPAVSLPQKEYIELTNRTDFSFSTKNWFLETESQRSLLPSTEIRPGGIIILCSAADTSLFSLYGKTIGLKSFPSLTDDGKMIWLSDSSGNLIHGIEYSTSWYGDKLKEAGGWSLEMIDTGYPFYNYGNWEASSSIRGGTPGNINSASRSNPDNDFYGIENVFPVDSVTVILSVSETLTSLASSPENIMIDDKIAESVIPSDPLLRSFIIRPAHPLTGGKKYTLFLTGDIHDFSGNDITKRSFVFGIPEVAVKSDILFNEILFNPFPEEPDYIELYNNSEKIVDASRLYLASINAETGDTSEINPLSVDHRCIMPGSFYVATTVTEKVIERYPFSDPENIFVAPSLPSMTDERGHLLLLNREMMVIDEVIYNDDMHYSLLADNEGVSLEKIRPDLLSAESKNWHSASESSGWGTPGTENSVFSPAPDAGDMITFSSGRVSPDNDGFEDVLVIDINPEGLGNVITITIFNEKGGFTRRITENFLSGEKASVVWDATASGGSLVDSGIYVILIELYNDKGKTKSWKKVCAVVR